MYLYHGTWEDTLGSILDEGCIRIYEPSEATQAIDRVFEDIQVNNPRGSCVYLSKDSDSADAYDYAFKIDTDRLNSNLLFVGGYNIIDAIYVHIMSGKYDKKLLRRLTKQYTESIIGFDEYEKVKENYNKSNFPEFMYFGEIEVTENDLN